MRFGRDAKSRQPVQNRSGRAGGLSRFVFFIALLVLAAGAYIIVAPVDQLTTMIDRILPGETPREIIETPSPTAPKQVVMPTDTVNKSVALNNLEALTVEAALFDPVQRSNRVAVINAAAQADRKANLKIASDAMNGTIEQVNDLIAKATNARPEGDADQVRYNERLSAHRAAAQHAVQKFNIRTEEINLAIDTETSRRMKILRGLKEVN